MKKVAKYSGTFLFLAVGLYVILNFVPVEKSIWMIAAILIVSAVWLYVKFRKAVSLEKNRIGIQFIED